MKKTVSPVILETLKSKAKKSPCTYKVAAIAFDKKGDILGTATNSHSRNWNVLEKYDQGRSNTGEHAEQKLFDRYGSNIKTIIICRVGHSGVPRPIDACPTCQKVAKKFGAKIISIKG